MNHFLSHTKEVTKYYRMFFLLAEIAKMHEFDTILSYVPQAYTDFGTITLNYNQPHFTTFLTSLFILIN